MEDCENGQVRKGLETGDIQRFVGSNPTTH